MESAGPTSEQHSFFHLQEQALQDVQLLSSVANQAAVLFSSKFQLFPHKLFASEDLKAPAQTSAPLLEEVRQHCSEARSLAAAKETAGALLPPFSEGDTPEEFEAVNEGLRQQFEHLLAAIHTFDNLHAKELRQWIQTIQPPTMQGLGPAANQALTAVTTLEQLLHNLGRMQAAQQGISGMASEATVRDETVSGRIGKVVKNQMAGLSQLAAECEAEIGDLEKSRHILAAALPRKGLQERL